jgi:hypothetical protein
MMERQFVKSALLSLLWKVWVFITSPAEATLHGDITGSLEKRTHLRG